MMQADRENTWMLELEGCPVTMNSYRIGRSFLAEIASNGSGATLARATGHTAEEAWQEALDTASRRLLRAQYVDPALTVGG
jgi:hypothetical protein